jgi:hypothetical protein
VDSAYGENKKYLEPLRNKWEGSEGIIWLLLTPRRTIQGGGFYLDRSPCTKHIAGPFFTEGIAVLMHVFPLYSNTLMTRV